jgi:septal ring factor EnvC (AmiA/AmiB activator)
MTLQDQYLNGARSAWSDAVTSWSHSVQDAAAQARTPFALVNPNPLLTQWVTVARQLQQANLEYAVNLLHAVSVASDAGSKYIDTVRSAIGDQVQALSDTLQEQLNKTDQIVQERAEQMEQAERDQVRQARAAERREARQAEQTARQRYEGKAKSELSDELSTRDLPKTGTVDELIDRLVEADTK